MMVGEVLSLPVAVQITLASGCAAYFVAYAGIRGHHRTIDIAFITLVFSLVATATVVVVAPHWGPIGQGCAAFAVSLVSAILWRKWGRGIVRSLLRLLNLSWTDDDHSALVTLTANVRFPVSQIAVLLDDGTWLRCDDTRLFNDAPYGPCLIGPEGDVALYLTVEESPQGSVKAMKTVRDPNFGDRITYIPASRIRRLTLRHMK